MGGGNTLGMLYSRQVYVYSATRNLATVFTLVGVGCSWERTRGDNSQNMTQQDANACRKRYHVYQGVQYYVRSGSILLLGCVAAEWSECYLQLHLPRDPPP